MSDWTVGIIGGSTLNATRRESLMYRKWGTDVIGMAAMPEARLAREA